MKPVVAIALSGGVDSLVSASLLKRQGRQVFGIHFTTGLERPGSFPVVSGMKRLSKQLDIPIHVVDLGDVFRTSVVDYFIRTYRQGMTPNPCLVCNPAVKFHALYKKAAELGAEHLATGHYARVDTGPEGRFRLLRGADLCKDQSYFLAFLSQEQLSRACFPLGNLTKQEVVDLSLKEGLVPATRGESQDICFIHEKGYSKFLEEYGGVKPEPGPIVTVEGETVGRHPGLQNFTVGQRRGINIPSSKPYYVVRLLPKTNTLLVGRKDDLVSRECRVASLSWIAPPAGFPMTAQVRLRYRHTAVPADLSMDDSGAVSVKFHTPQTAPTPGQGAVFYQADEIIGAGIISP